MSDQQYLFLIRALLSTSLTPSELAALRASSGAITATNVVDHPFPESSTSPASEEWAQFYGPEGNDFWGQLGFVVAVATATDPASAAAGLGDLVRGALNRTKIIECVSVRRLTAYDPDATSD